MAVTINRDFGTTWGADIFVNVIEMVNSFNGIVIHLCCISFTMFYCLALKTGYFQVLYKWRIRFQLKFAIYQRSDNCMKLDGVFFLLYVFNSLLLLLFCRIYTYFFAITKHFQTIKHLCFIVHDEWISTWLKCLQFPFWSYLKNEYLLIVTLPKLTQIRFPNAR